MPRLSIILIVYKMPRQALNTIYSLSMQHQQNVCADDYEIIVVENNSSQPLNEKDVLAQGSNIKYFLRDETSQSPAKAINFGIHQSSGQWLGLMIDGARMVTPRVIEHVLMGQTADPDGIVTIPGYNLGPYEHQNNLSQNYSQDVEQQLLAKCNWQQNGYRLFDISNLSGANPKGIFHPLMECNCLFSSRKNFADIGNANEAFDLPGGGSLNLHMYRSLGITAQNHPLFITPGEGSFHQFHGGITTQEDPEREAVLESHRKQLHSFWDDGFSSWCKQPTLLGAATSHSLRFTHYSSKTMAIRARRRLQKNKDLWPDESNLWDAP